MFSIPYLRNLHGNLLHRRTKRVLSCGDANQVEYSVLKHISGTEQAVVFDSTLGRADEAENMRGPVQHKWPKFG